MGLEDAIESPGFYILGVGGTLMVIIGWAVSRNMDAGALPIWQLALIILVVWVASAFFAGRE